MSATPARHPAVAGAQMYGLLSVAGADVALPLSALREVVRCPAELAALPASAPGLLGAMQLRTLVVPVVDLRPVLGLPAAQRTPEQVVVVVAHDQHLLGVLADAVHDIMAVRHEDLLVMHTGADGDGQPSLFSHTFRRTGSVVSVLDAAALLALPGSPTVRDAGPTRPTTTVAGETATGAQLDRAGASAPTLTLMRCGEHLLALDVEHVHTLLPPSTPTPSVLDNALCKGVTEVADRQAAVVDPLALLGLEHRTATASRSKGGDGGDARGAGGIVLKLEHGYVVLAVTALLDLTQVATHDVLPLPSAAAGAGALLAGIVDLGQLGPCLVIDGDALRSHPELVALSSLNTLTAGGAPTDDVGGAGPQSTGARTSPTSAPARAVSAPAPRVVPVPYLRYSVGSDLVTALEQVSEILPLAQATVATGSADPSLLGVLVHRGEPLPVLCLSTLLGLSPSRSTAPSRHLLVVHTDPGGQRAVAFAVEALRDIAPLAWRDVDATPPADCTPLRKLMRASPLVCTGTSTDLLPELDLSALARRVSTGTRDDELGTRACDDGCDTGHGTGSEPDDGPTETGARCGPAGQRQAELSRQA